MAYTADGNRTPPDDLISAPQTLTNGWVDLGEEKDIDRMEKAILWLQVNANDSVDIRARLLLKTEYGGALEYPIQIETVSASAVNLVDEYKEIDTAGDVNVPIRFDLNGAAPVGQFQVKAGTLGATAGIILTALWSAKR